VSRYSDEGSPSRKSRKHGRFAFGSDHQEIRPGSGDGAAEAYNGGGEEAGGKKKFRKRKLGLWGMVALTVSMGGSQVSSMVTAEMCEKRR
jgi:hypothetical protein